MVHVCTRNIGSGGDAGAGEDVGGALRRRFATLHARHHRRRLSLHRRAGVSTKAAVVTTGIDAPHLYVYERAKPKNAGGRRSTATYGGRARERKSLSVSVARRLSDLLRVASVRKRPSISASRNVRSKKNSTQRHDRHRISSAVRTTSRLPASACAVNAKLRGKSNGSPCARSTATRASPSWW